MDGKAKILVADDEKEIRQILGMVLGEEGYEAVMARDGQEAVQLASEDIDLYILDVNMPRGTSLKNVSKVISSLLSF